MMNKNYFELLKKEIKKMVEEGLVLENAFENIVAVVNNSEEAIEFIKNDKK